MVEEPVTMLDFLAADLRKRMAALRADRHKYTFFMQDMDPAELMLKCFVGTMAGMQRGQTLVGIAAGIGRQVRKPLKVKPDSITEVQTGWFIMISFFELEIMDYVLRSTFKNGKLAKNKSYYLKIVDWVAYKELISLTDKKSLGGIMPSRVPHADWFGPVHENGTTMVKKMHKDVKAKLHPSKQPLLFDNLNKLQNIGWRVNPETFHVFQQCLAQASAKRVVRNSPFKFTREADATKKKSLMREAEAIESIALAYLHDDFYHMYNYDFRFRVYVLSAYMHEQSSDNAKGMLQFAKGVPLGSEGLEWLKVHTSNCFGFDKATIAGRIQFVDQRLEDFLDYADNPLTHKGWMEADSPFSFLSCCFELRKIKDWIVEGNSIASFVSHLPCYIDGSTNGTQHLTAMSKDETIAHLVNLVPTEKPGDLYMFIAGHVWSELRKANDGLTPDQINRFPAIWAEAKRLQKAYTEAPPKSEQKAAAYVEAAEWRNANRDIRKALFPVYWLGVTNPKDQRKATKRPVMTLGYGGSSFGLGNQVIDYTREASEYLRDMEHLWGALLGRLVYDTCYKELPGPARMLRLFQELARQSNSRGEYLAWTVPFTNAPVIQAYRKPDTFRTKLSYGSDVLAVSVESWDEASLDQDASLTGAAPNIVHSFDAAHLAMVLYIADFPMSVIHDSFGSHAGNMHKLFKISRQEFAEFYRADPLALLLEELMASDMMPERGTLDTDLIMESDYAFL